MNPPPQTGRGAERSGAGSLFSAGPPRWWTGPISCLLGLGAVLFLLVVVFLLVLADEAAQVATPFRFLPLATIPSLLIGFTLGVIGRMNEVRWSLPGILINGAGMLLAAGLLIQGFVG